MRRSVERAGWKVLGQFLLLLLVATPFIWPIMFLPDRYGWPTSWLVQAIWTAFGGIVLYLAMRREGVRRQRAAQARAAAVTTELQYRALMIQTGRPWYDGAGRCIRHGSCTIRHRSTGAALRCRNTV